MNTTETVQQALDQNTALTKSRIRDLEREIEGYREELELEENIDPEERAPIWHEIEKRISQINHLIQGHE